MLFNSNAACVYKIYNKINDYIYIGETNNLKVRLNLHHSTLKGNKHASELLQTDFNEHGFSAFRVKILTENEHYRERLKVERRLIRELEPLYNTQHPKNPRFPHLPSIGRAFSRIRNDKEKTLTVQDVHGLLDPRTEIRFVRLAVMSLCRRGNIREISPGVYRPQEKYYRSSAYEYLYSKEKT